MGHEEIDRKILEFAYTMALRDAVLQKAYEGKKKILFDNSRVKQIIS